MKYKNSNYKKIRGSFIMIVSCGHCKTDLARYQKLGRGGLINMYVDRIIESEFDTRSEDRGLMCSNCGEQIASRMVLKNENVEAYKMMRSTFHTREE